MVLRLRVQPLPRQRLFAGLEVADMPLRQLVQRRHPRPQPGRSSDDRVALEMPQNVVLHPQEGAVEEGAELGSVEMLQLPQQSERPTLFESRIEIFHHRVRLYR